MDKKKKALDGFKLTPFYVLKEGDLVRVKEFARGMAGMVGLVLSKEDYNTACDATFLYRFVHKKNISGKVARNTNESSPKSRPKGRSKPKTKAQRLNQAQNQGPKGESPPKTSK